MTGLVRSRVQRQDYAIGSSVTETSLWTTLAVGIIKKVDCANHRLISADACLAARKTSN